MAGGENLMVEITEVRVSLRDDEKLKAFVSITLNDSFVIRGLKIIHGNTGLFVAMPSRKRPDGQHQDLAHPINDATRKYLTDIVMAEYQRELTNQGAVTSPRSTDRDRH
jgi:stage V sporulation protein G